MTTRTMPSGAAKRQGRPGSGSVGLHVLSGLRCHPIHCLGEKRTAGRKDAPDVSAAIQQALEQVARNWKCGTDVHSVYGIAKGDVNGGLR
jgi:hypothetical protein